MEAWGFDDESAVLPPLQESHGSIALWHGQFNQRDETPVFAVSFGDPNTHTINKLIGWFYGIALRADIPEGDGALEAYLDAAINSAETLAHTLGALILLAPTEQLQPTH